MYTIYKPWLKVDMFISTGEIDLWPQMCFLKGDKNRTRLSRHQLGEDLKE